MNPRIVTSQAASLFPRDWEQLAPLVDRLLDTPANDRSGLLTELSGGDSARRAALERLIAECERDLPLLDRPAVEQFDRLLAEEPLLPEVLSSRYRMERELGRGGMARVFLAHDLKHGRPVAVKVIRPELAASLGRERFLREIGIAARLRHPNIMPLFDSGDVDGLLYFVMPYEDGLSLRARLQRDGRLGTADAISILRDVARALAYAHEHGVVHRDVKPDNVLLSGDAAVVTDFGIAKAFSVSLNETAASAPAIEPDAVIGTPAYMAPEQARGDPDTDHRADIYSFGCLAYEVFTGEPPFVGSTTLELIAAQLATAAPPVVRGRAEVPPAIAEMIAQCLQKDPAARPQSAGALLDVLGGVAAPGSAGTHRKTLVRASIISITLAGVLSAGYFAFQGTTAGPATVAVLPFINLSGDSSRGVLAAGFGDEIATALGSVPWVRVMSRQGAGNYAGKGNIDVRSTGKTLGVRYLVTGALHQVGERHTISAKLTNVASGSVVWAAELDRPADLSALRDRIATTIGDSLRSRVGLFPPRASRPRPAHRRPDSEAYLLYLIGERELHQRAQNLAGSVEHFRQAIALDPLAAEAWSGLSLALALSAQMLGRSSSEVDPEATSSARRALALDPNIGEAHVALGVVAGRNLQWDIAESEIETALGLDPHDVEARIQYARLFVVRGKVADAIRELQKARDDDPASAVVLSMLSCVWYMRGQFDSALVQSDRALQSDSLNLLNAIFRPRILASMGRRDEARQILKRIRVNHPVGLYTMAFVGETASVRARLDTIARTRTNRWPETARAYGMLGLGDTAEALDALERATAIKEPWASMGGIGDPMFDAIRESVRFRGLLTRVGLAGK